MEVSSCGNRCGVFWLLLFGRSSLNKSIESSSDLLQEYAVLEAQLISCHWLDTFGMSCVCQCKYQVCFHLSLCSQTWRESNLQKNFFRPAWNWNWYPNRIILSRNRLSLNASALLAKMEVKLFLKKLVHQNNSSVWTILKLQLHFRRPVKVYLESDKEQFLILVFFPFV